MRINEVEIAYKTKNLFLEDLDEKNYTSLDSYTIDQETKKISGLIVLNRQEYLPSPNDVKNYLSMGNNESHMLQRIHLARILKVPLFLISMENNFTKTQILQLDNNIDFTGCAIVDRHTNGKRLFDCTELNNFFKDLRKEKRENIKPLEHIDSNDIIKKFHNVGVNLGGNLDGFIVDIQTGAINLVEFSKIGATEKNIDTNGSKTMSYNFQNFMNKDFGRWHALETLRKEIASQKPVNLDVIIWSFQTPFVKLFKDVSFKGERNSSLQAVFAQEIKLNLNSVNKPKI